MQSRNLPFLFYYLSRGCAEPYTCSRENVTFFLCYKILSKQKDIVIEMTGSAGTNFGKAIRNHTYPSLQKEKS